MKMSCGDADCPGEDRQKGDFCPCRKVHFSLEEVLIDFLIENDMARKENGKVVLWGGASWVDWREHEKWMKEKIVENKKGLQ